MLFNAKTNDRAAELLRLALALDPLRQERLLGYGQGLAALAQAKAEDTGQKQPDAEQAN